MNNGVIPPYSQEAEQGAIASILTNPDAISETNLSSGDFFLGIHQVIWAAFERLYQAGTSIDFVTVVDQLTKDGKIEEIGGPAKLAEFLTLAHMSFNFAHYVEIIKRYSWKRRCLVDINKIAQGIFNEQVDENEFGAVVESSVNSMLSGRASPGTMHVSNVLETVYEEVSRRYENPVDIWGMQTGLTDLDTLLGGLHTGEIMGISGPPGVGKSRIALQAAVGLAKAGHPGIVYSLEMTNLALGYRGISSFAEVATRKLKTGQMDENDWTRFFRAYESMSGLPLYFNDRPQTIQSLRADIIKMQRQHGCKWFVLDYMLLMDGYENLGDTDRSTMLSRGIKSIVKEGLAGIILQSITKTGMDGQPKLSDMRGSGQVIHDADMVAFVTQDVMNPSILRMTFEKVRDISSGKRILEFYAYTGFPKIGNAKISNVQLGEL